MTTLQPGEVFERRYRIAEQLGRGGFATVYLAEHIDIGHQVAIKLLHRASAGERFVREAAILAELSNEHTIRLLDFGYTEDRAPYMIFEYVEGEPLDHYLKRCGALDWRTATSIVRQILSSLAEASARGIVHRDVKPANVMITAEGVVKVLDFGVAKVTADAELSPGADLTLSGATIGTPAYMAPELVRNAASASPAADMFSLGVMAWEMLIGRRMHEQRSSREIFERHLSNGRYELPPDVDVPGPLRAFFDSLLRKDPHERPAEGNVALEELSRALEEVERAERGGVGFARLEFLQDFIADLTGGSAYSEDPDDDTTLPSPAPDPHAASARSADTLAAVRDWYMIAFVAFVLSPVGCLISSVVLLEEGVSLRVGVPIAVLLGSALIVLVASFARSEGPDAARTGGVVVRWLLPLGLLSFAWTAVVANLDEMAWLSVPLVATIFIVVLRMTASRGAATKAWWLELVASGVAAAVGVVSMVDGYRTQTAIEQAGADGAETGRRGGGRACLPRALERQRTCQGGHCREANREFLTQCLDASGPDALCDGLPSPFGHRSEVAWGAAVCRQYRRAGDEECAAFVGPALYDRCAWRNYDPDASFLDF